MWTGTVPYKAGAALLAPAPAATFAFDIGGSGARPGSHHLDHRRRNAFKQADGRALGFREVASRRHRPRRRLRKQQPVEIGLSDQRGQQHDQHDGGNLGKTRAHQFTPKPTEVGSASQALRDPYLLKPDRSFSVPDQPG